MLSADLGEKLPSGAKRPIHLQKSYVRAEARPLQAKEFFRSL
jgi:hypothetical protein